MSTNKYTSAVLTVIALSLAVLAYGQFSMYFNIPPVKAASTIRQNWEYKRIVVEYFHTEDVSLPLGITGVRAVFTEKWYEDGVLQTGELNYTNLYNRLGMQGWELVTAVTESDYVTPKTGMEQDVNGSTSEVRYIFKRPKN